MKIQDFKRKKQQQNTITMITCYDYPSAKIADESSIDCVLVGDSLAMVVHGYDNTLMATMDMMVLHTQAVARGLTHPFLVTDLPFLCHKASRSETIHHVKQLLKAGAHAVKIEGGDPDTCDTIQFLVTAGIPVMGHIGLTAQSIHQLGGHRVQGKTASQATLLLQQAKALEAAGCFAIVLECMPPVVADTITKALEIPTIGIGAGNVTDGQVLVWHDLLGMQTEFKPKFVKYFANTKSIMLDAINHYVQQVQTREYPGLEHTYANPEISHEDL